MKHVHSSLRLAASQVAMVASCLSLLVGCGAEVDGAEESIDSVSDGVINGNAPDPATRPYENQFVRVNNKTKNTTCSGTLVGSTRTTADYVLTARHCFNDTNDTVTFSGAIGTVRGVAINFAPGLDVALVQLERTVPAPAGIYFTNSNGQKLIGVNVRCYGYGYGSWDPVTKKYGGLGKLRWADFTIADHGGSTDYYDLDVPNANGQALAGGDSGGTCFSIPGDGNTALTVTGIHKAGSKSGVPTYNDQTAATTFSAWVRTFVARP